MAQCEDCELPKDHFIGSDEGHFEVITRCGCGPENALGPETGIPFSSYAAAARAIQAGDIDRPVRKAAPPTNGGAPWHLTSRNTAQSGT